MASQDNFFGYIKNSKKTFHAVLPFLLLAIFLTIAFISESISGSETDKEDLMDLISLAPVVIAMILLALYIDYRNDINIEFNPDELKGNQYFMDYTKGTESQKRIRYYESELRKMLENNNSFIIFNADTPNHEYVQFANNGEGFMLDLPNDHLTEEGIKELKKTIKNIHKNEFINGYSLQKEFRKQDIEWAAKLTEFIFRKIFSLPENYKVTVKPGQVIR